jgi:uncharacterized membrane protein
MQIPTIKLIFSYLLTAVVFFAIDIVWLGFLAKGLYRKFLGDFLSDEVNWAAAITFYLIFIVGIFIFAIVPAVEKASWQHALLYGVLFGFFTYITYELTNMATLKDWPLTIVLIDTVWGCLLTGSTALAGYFITRALAG